MQQISRKEAKERFDELIQAVLQGDTVQIATEEGTVQMSAIPSARRRRFGSARGLVTIREDFEAPLDDFVAYSG
ncbi:MAG: hypothetical protein KatS3mg022_2519 [Armatimonadota bacterium]|nr:MAG: hypothetical protein KatS3mg022_2519 [Armatimonadota bacterium]